MISSSGRIQDPGISPPSGVIRIVNRIGYPSTQPAIRTYVATSTSWTLRAPIDTASARVHPSTALPPVMATRSTSAIGGIPPRFAARARTGTTQRTPPSTGSNRAASVPSTISGALTSVISIRQTCPRALSVPNVPAVAAGAASSTIAS